MTYKSILTRDESWKPTILQQRALLQAFVNERAAQMLLGPSSQTHPVL